ncbi:MAG: cytochrome c oxidase assembly protein [Chloroflexi bacterium]|nr:cytochrome c oxidase assembly protein [Chloroflexota bacterium]
MSPLAAEVNHTLAASTDESFSWWYWHWHPDLYSGLLLFTGLYLLYVGPLRGRLVWPDVVRPSRGQVVSFLAGVVVMLFALAGPVHELAESYLFSAHMAQHVLIILVVPPLLLLGTPGWLLRPILRFDTIMRLGKLFTHPVVAFALFNAVFAGWHFPVFYEGALRAQGFHILQHLLFMATAVIMWWPILSPLPELPRLNYPAQMLYLIFMSIAQTPLFAAITFSSSPIYSFYEAAPRVWGISPLADQQIGGIIMKLSWLVVFLPAICIVFLRWFYREEGEGSQEFGPPVRDGHVG